MHGSIWPWFNKDCLALSKLIDNLLNVASLMALDNSTLNAILALKTLRELEGDINGEVVDRGGRHVEVFV